MSEPLAPGPLWPGQVAALYGLPGDRSAAGQCVGVISAAGGYLASDLEAAAAASAVPAPQVVATAAIADFGVDPQADQELALDLQVLAATAPGVRLAIYPVARQAAALGAGLAAALDDGENRPGVLVVCWGSAESTWSADAIQSMEDALGRAADQKVSVVVASGDFLATGGFLGALNVFYPASSPQVLACGGTAITLDDAGDLVREEAWNDAATRAGTGGGYSTRFPQPGYQQALGPADGRGVPDVAAVAAFEPGWRIVLDGEVATSGGTSAAAPFWGGVVALANARRATPIGLVNPALYARPDLLRPITLGDNRVQGVGYDAGPGWNACCGLGVPRGADVLAALIAAG